MNTPEIKKKYIRRGMALFLSVILILTDPVGYRTVHAEEEISPGSAANQEVQEEQALGGETQGSQLAETGMQPEAPQVMTAAEQPAEPAVETEAPQPITATPEPQPEAGTETDVSQTEMASEEPQPEGGTETEEPQPEKPQTEEQTENTSEAESETSTEAESESETNTEFETETETETDTQQLPDQMTIQELRARKEKTFSTRTLSVPMYIEDDNTEQGTYPFAGGDITGIENQKFTVDGLELNYAFERAVIHIVDGASTKTYPINYYDEITEVTTEGTKTVRYYALADEDGSAAHDFDIAYVVPEGAQVVFVFGLDTTSYEVTLTNDKEAEGFKVEFLSGIEESAVDGKLTAKYYSRIKLKLTYPSGYYTESAPAGKETVGIKFDDPNVTASAVVNKDPINRTITYSFRYPDKAMTMTVTGDKETNGLIFGLCDGTANAQAYEKIQNWWRATDAAGNYVSGRPYYGTEIPRYNDGIMQSQGGTAKAVYIGGKSKMISTGTFSSEQTLHFEYYCYRYNPNAPGGPAYFFWPSSVVSLCYFPNGAKYSTDTPIVETFPLWDSGMNVSLGTVTEPKIYTSGSGATIKITIKQADRVEQAATGTVGGNVTLQVPRFLAHVEVTGMKNSFYLKTQAAGGTQGPHYFRNLDNISLDMVNGSFDSYFVDGGSQETGGNTGELGIRGISSNGSFLDKLAVFNKNMPGGNGVPWKDPDKPLFKFGITPKWGYTLPYIENDEGGSITQTNHPVEAENTSGAPLALGSYSWFNENQNRSGVSPFQYTLFMDVDSLKAQHPTHAIDIKVKKIEGSVTNNNEFPGTDPNVSNHIVDNPTFDLLSNDKIIFNENFEAPKRENETFVGFVAEITAPGNPVLRSDYVLKLGKTVTPNPEDSPFKPGDSISLSDYFKRDSLWLYNTWKNGGVLTPDEQDRLNLLMYSDTIAVRAVPVYKPGTNVDGAIMTGKVNKYLQDVNQPDIQYLGDPSDTKEIKVIGGSQITFSRFAETFLKQSDPYTYYYNNGNTTFKHTVDTEGEEIAYVAYDKGLTVTYSDSANPGSPFNNNPITDPTIYKTYDGSNKAVIRFPDETQYPAGKAFDYWTVEELQDDGVWTPKTDFTISQGDTATAVYTFASGTDANNKSIRLTAVWKNILPDSYITIPKSIVLTENNTNLEQGKYAGAKVTVNYQSVYGNDAHIYVDVLKSFDLALATDTNQKITVYSYGDNAQPLADPGAGPDYARVGEFSPALPSKNIWFNVESQKGNETYKGTFNVSSEQAQLGSVLFYISAAPSGGAGS